ncbi:hypothetical protein DTV68_24705 [Salmonella enterica subsp. enterica serovar Kedougou]|nr:hypothetical protein [Salmonella enterica subsp. enterica serovar Corvallis]EAC1261520.1 hypothetical protein [Salmonella enterica subsp. enterica serovar Kedougou]EAN6754391.1 hypothetical protein [Salmonella enterica]EBS6561106.1 hypothetical protein [Salmonella enterica subsp. enterica serovar Braenderup]EBV1026288.1 hypothetical protein [Salmonella enterica subsp. enterica serovar Ohio]EBW6739400.1 hypothetical protein [Salmonella enterica subsp. enterica serovar Oranienburg]EBX3863419
MRDRRYSASSLTDSLRSVVRLRRAEWAYKLGGNFLEDARAILSKEEARPRRCRFSIGSAPLTSITKSDAQISGGETRQDLKIPGVSPWWLPRALSCSCLSVYRCHSAVMAAVSHSTPDTRFREGSSLQAGLYARTPRSVRLLRLIR